MENKTSEYISQLSSMVASLTTLVIQVKGMQSVKVASRNPSSPATKMVNDNVVRERLFNGLRTNLMSERIKESPEYLSQKSILEQQRLFNKTKPLADKLGLFKDVHENKLKERVIQSASLLKRVDAIFTKATNAGKGSEARQLFDNSYASKLFNSKTDLNNPDEFNKVQKSLDDFDKAIKHTVKGTSELGKILTGTVAVFATNKIVSEGFNYFNATNRAGTSLMTSTNALQGAGIFASMENTQRSAVYGGAGAIAGAGIGLFLSRGNPYGAMIGGGLGGQLGDYFSGKEDKRAIYRNSQTILGELSGLQGHNATVDFEKFNSTRNVIDKMQALAISGVNYQNQNKLYNRNDLDIINMTGNHLMSGGVSSNQLTSYFGGSASDKNLARFNYAYQTGFTGNQLAGSLGRLDNTIGQYNLPDPSKFMDTATNLTTMGLGSNMANEFARKMNLGGSASERTYNSLISQAQGDPLGLYFRRKIAKNIMGGTDPFSSAGASRIGSATSTIIGGNLPKGRGFTDLLAGIISQAPGGTFSNNINRKPSSIPAETDTSTTNFQDQAKVQYDSMQVNAGTVILNTHSPLQNDTNHFKDIYKLTQKVF